MRFDDNGAGNGPGTRALDDMAGNICQASGTGSFDDAEAEVLLKPLFWGKVWQMLLATS